MVASKLYIVQNHYLFLTMINTLLVSTFLVTELVFSNSNTGNSIVFSLAIFWVARAGETGAEDQGYGSRANGQGTQTPIKKGILKKYSKDLVAILYKIRFS